jgi:hypothetical protein
MVFGVKYSVQVYLIIFNLELPQGQVAKKIITGGETKQAIYEIDQNHLKGHARHLSLGAIYHVKGYGGYLLEKGSESKNVVEDVSSPPSGQPSRRSSTIDDPEKPLVIGVATDAKKRNFFIIRKAEIIPKKKSASCMF